MPLANGPRILLIDEDASDRALAAMVLSKDLPDARILEIGDATAFAKALSTRRLDLVITEHRLSWSDGLAVADAVRESRPSVPVLMLTSERDEELAVTGMKGGLADYLVKSSKSYLRLADAAAEALEKARTERLVARSEPWLQTLLDRANVGVFRSSPDGRLIETNPALLRLLGVSSVQEALELDLPLHFDHAENREDLIQRLSRAGELQARVIEHTRPDGSKVWLNLSEVLLLDVDGDMVVDVLVQDITHLKEHERAASREAAELERSRSGPAEFASIASHELKEPLRMVEKYTELLAHDLEGQLDDESQRSMEFVLDGARRMRSLIEGLLSFSRVDTGWQTFKACDCNTLVEEALHQLEEEIRESAAEIRREGLPTILGDPSELGQLFQNLIGNAIRFRGERPPSLRISVLRGEEEWIFSIKDNGIGIDPLEAKSIFEIFKRLHPEIEGTGIGLAICRRIVEKHGGRIWVESTPGQGSTFSFTIPMSPDRSADHPDAAMSESSEEKGR